MVIPIAVTVLYTLLTALFFLFAIDFTSKGKRKELAEGLGGRSALLFLVSIVVEFVVIYLLWLFLQEDIRKMLFPLEVYDGELVSKELKIIVVSNLILAPALTYSLIFELAFGDTDIKWQDYFMDR
jgi:hypothetical protein